MKKRYVILLIIGIILLIVPFLFSTYSMLRIISLALGIFIITLSLALFRKQNIFLIILIPIILICLSYAIDTFMFYKFNRIPIFAYEIKSSDTVSTYNSFFYRIYNCHGKLTLDYGYQNKYTCAIDDLKEININDFLNDPNESYDNYKNKFVKISGKISKISGNEFIELSPYTTAANSLNGYVNFNKNYIIHVNAFESLSNYRIYDNITVIGKVSNKVESNGIITISLADSLLIPSDIYDSYSYEIVNSNTTDLTSLVSEQNYYLYGISSLNVKYANDAIYELSYLITDSRITLDDIIDNKTATNLYDEEENLVAKSYELDKFNVLVCNNDKKIIANKSYKLEINLCE